MGTNKGKEIDGHELVIRMNWGGAVLPVLRPEDVGRRTNVLFMAHRDFSFCLTGPDCRSCVPHALHPTAHRPREILQLTIVQVFRPRQLHDFALCRQKLGADAWRLQLAHPDALLNLGSPVEFARAVGKPSSGMLAFIQAAALCDRISLFGFFGSKGGKGAPYHAYKWCDVDRVFGITTKDCNLTKEGNTKRSETGFNIPTTKLGHEFDKERTIMQRPALQAPSQECRARCAC